MSNKKKRTGGMPPRKGSATIWLLVLGVIVVAGAGLWWTSQPPGNSNPNKVPAANNVSSVSPPVDIGVVNSNALNFNTNDTNITIMEVAHSVMVTHVLDFGDRVPSPGEAIQYIDRLSKPDDGVGRTFSILEAAGFTNKEAGGGSLSTVPSGSTHQDTTSTNAKPKLQMSLRISTEKPGLAAIVFRPTGKILWQARINPEQGPPRKEKQLTVMLEEEDGKQAVVDGSKNPTTILDAAIHESPLSMREFWPNGSERMFTFIYSACGCPIKAKVRRVGEKTMRVSDWPVLFPDDPDAMRVINSLMGWPDDGVKRLNNG
jgi:hypothetical protein